MASNRQPQSPDAESHESEAQSAVPSVSTPMGSDPPPPDFVTVDEYTEEQEEPPSVIPKYPAQESSDDLFRLPEVPAQIELPVRLSTPPRQPEIPVFDLEDPKVKAEFDHMLAEEPKKRWRSRGKRRHRRAGASSDAAPSQSGASGLGYAYPPPLHEPLPPSQRRVTVDSRGGATAMRVALPGSAQAQASARGKPAQDVSYAGVNARKRRAAATYRDLNIQADAPGPSSFRDRPGEAGLGAVFDFPKEMVWNPVRNPPYEIDLDRQVRREHPWRPLRADRQTTKIPYYEIRSPVTEASPTETRLFGSLDVFLPYLFARLYRLPWVREGDDPDLPPKDPISRGWQLQYEAAMRSWDETASSRNPNMGIRNIAIEARRRWAAIRTVAASTHLLRRANQEPEFGDLLLRLPRAGQGYLVGTSLVLGPEYIAILRETQHRLIQNLRAPVGGMSADILLLDSHLTSLNWMAGPNGLVPGRVLRCSIHGYAGANTRSIVWLRQALVTPATRRVAWLIGTNDAEFVPPPTKDDRPEEERRLAPRREDPNGQPRRVTYAQLGMAIAYPARLIRTLFPTLEGMFIFELPPRFDYLGSDQIHWPAFVDVPRDVANIQMWKANPLLQRMLGAEPRIHMLTLSERLYHPYFYWRPHGYNQHPDSHVLYQAISYALQWVRGMGPPEDNDPAA